MKAYDSLFRMYSTQSLKTVFAHFYPLGDDYDAPFKAIADNSWDGMDAWEFTQDRFKNKYPP